VATSLDQYFEQLYLINLPERHDRRVSAIRELKSVGTTTDCPNLEIFAAIKPAEAGEFPSIGALGCVLSHLAILKTAQKRQLANVLIMEDDVGFSPYFIKHQAEILEQVAQQQWDFLYLGHVRPSHRPVNPEQSPVEWQPQPGTVPLSTTHCVAIKGAMFAPLIDLIDQAITRPLGHPQGGPMNIDGLYSTFREQHPEVITLIAQPCLALQCSSPSDLAGVKWWFDRLPIFRQVASVGRACKTYARKQVMTR
jgi:hypothetical protein